MNISINLRLDCGDQELQLYLQCALMEYLSMYFDRLDFGC